MAAAHTDQLHETHLQPSHQQPSWPSPQAPQQGRHRQARPSFLQTYSRSGEQAPGTHWTPCDHADQTLVFQMMPLLGLLRAGTLTPVTLLQGVVDCF